MKAVWGWEAPPVFFSGARLITADEALTPQEVADLFGTHRGRRWEWLWILGESGEDFSRWGECFLIDAVSLTRLSHDRVARLFGTEFQPAQPKPQAEIRPDLLSAKEVAAKLGLGLSTAKRLVLPHLRRVTIGGSVRYEEEEVKRWADMQKGGSSRGPRPGPSIVSASRTTVSASTDPRVQATMERLQRRLRRSTRG